MSKRHKDPGNGNPIDETEARSPADAVPESSDSGDSTALKALIAEKDKEIAELKDKYLRTLAESENVRKRIRQQSEESVRIQREAVLRDLLPIVDNLERAVEAAASAGTDSKTIVDGVQMVLRSLHDYLKAQGVTSISTTGQTFDPTRHEAVDHVVSEAHPPNTVVDEFNRGYQMGDRILRPARVSVSKDTRHGAHGRSNGESDSSDIENN